MIPARILGTSSLLPGRVVTNEEVSRSLSGWSAGRIEQSTGIHTRSWAAPDTRSSTLGADVLRLALEDADMKPTELRRIMFASSAGGDTLIPANANQVANALGADGTADAFDVNNACLGFLTALDIAARSVATGLSPVGIAVVEVFSDLTPPEDPRTFLISGDAAAAAVVGPARPGEGILGVHLGNKGSLGGTVQMLHPRGKKAYEPLEFTVSSKRMLDLALELMQASTKEVLSQSGLRLDEIDWVLPHQPNGKMLELIVRTFGVDQAKFIPVVQEIGSTGAAALPLSLDRLLRTRRVAPGDRILMVSVGTGVSYGAMIYQVAPD